MVIKPTSGESLSRLPLNKVEKMKCPVEESWVRRMRQKEQSRAIFVLPILDQARDREKGTSQSGKLCVTNLREPGLWLA